MPCVVLDSVISNLRLWIDQQSVIGEILAPVKVSVPGKKPVMQLTLKIQGANSGLATEVKPMLLSMNFEEGSTFRTFLDGSIVIHSVWKRKGVRNPSVLPESGSPPTSTLPIGTQTSTTELGTLF